jgi:predicted helicase
VPTTIQELIDQLRAASGSDAECGDRFERLMLAYLRTDQMWFSRFSKVWLWRDWDGREGEVDTGIDLVAEHRDGSGFTAVQCKCYAPTTMLDMQDLGTFFTRSGKPPFTARMIIATTNRWTKHLRNAIEGQDKPTVKVTLGELEASTVDWSQWDAAKATLGRKPRKTPHPHQRAAIADVLEGFEKSDRGKLIMACGTGKTYTGLRVAEELAGAGGAVLVLLPSISLLSQTLKEWAADASVPLFPLAVCSDVKAGRRRQTEDLSPNDLLLPATTDPDELMQHAARATSEHMRVVFSTYQSIPVITAAQEAGFGRFDLVICDEAHRTTGVTLADKDDSNFTRVHDDAYVAAAKRLYMTATPRVYADTSKAKAAAADAVVASMDDEAVYGPEFYRIGFREAVDRDLLSDYKVLILAVDEEAIAAAFQRQLSDENHELRLDDATRIVGCLNALAKRNAHGDSFSDRDTAPMQTAVAFSTTIAQSKKFKNLFAEVAERYAHYCERPFSAEVEHVDGGFDALQREERLQWLKAAPKAEACRILSNARCLTEGVDVPGLDAIIFLEPRNSMVDVIQAVGRVMRKAPGKHLGYVILPIGIPAGVPPEEALADNKRFKVVWQVLNALRSHDDRLNAVVNKLDLNDETPDMVHVQPVGLGVPDHGDDDAPGLELEKPKQIAFDFPVEELRRAIYAQLVKKVGTRHYWEDWAADIARIAARHEARIRALVADPKLGLEPVFEEFVTGLRANLNDSITADDALGMLSQHLITRPVFKALFADYDFVGSNPVSNSMQAMLDRLDDHALGKETETLDQFYADVKLRAEGIDNARGKQRIITELYERFFSKAMPKTADALGIVYTPIEVVDFILRAAESALRRHLDVSLSDEGVHVLDPFTGTGTFIVRLLQSGLVRPHDLARKYVSEIHANEILLLAYYIAAINIESTYHHLTAGSGDGPYQSFPGIVYTDTFQLVEGGGHGGALFPKNNQRAVKQQALDIRVIVGNPPWSVGQGSANDDAANLAYPKLDGRIAETYAARSTATLKNSLYDSYVRALRWASDRVLAHADGGVVAFVSNGGYIDGNTADGIRLTLTREYHQLYVFNLRGNARISGEQRRKEKDNVFESGSRATVAILVAVKQPGAVPAEGATLHYRDIGDYLSREEKLAILRDAASDSDPLSTVSWTRLRPNAHGDWIHQRSERFVEFAPIHDPDDQQSIFILRSGGLKTNRDSWNYNTSRPKLEANVERMVAFFNQEVDRFAATKAKGTTAAQADAARKFANLDSTKFSWTRSDFQRMGRGQKLKATSDMFRHALYRPFQRQHANVSPSLNDAAGQLLKLYPTAEARTLAITVAGMAGSNPFTCLITDRVPDTVLSGAGNAIQIFPLLTYEKAEDPANRSLFDASDTGWRPNVSASAIKAYRILDASISAEDLFFYIYGILHARDYRETFAADLKKSLPRIPQVKTAEDFWAFSKAGRALADLHIGYETVEPWPNLEVAYAPDFDAKAPGAWRVEKMRYPKIDDPETGKKIEDKTRVLYNRHVTIASIPLRAHDYRLGSRSALDWVLNQYQVATDEPSGITNDPNDWATEHNEPRYIFDLLRRVVTVSLRTLDVVDSLPPLDLA